MNIRNNLGVWLATAALAVSIGGGVAVVEIQNSNTASQQATISAQTKTIDGLTAEVKGLKAKLATPASNLGFCYSDDTSQSISLNDGSIVTPVTFLNISSPSSAYGQPCLPSMTYVPVTPQKHSNG